MKIGTVYGLKFQTMLSLDMKTQSVFKEYMLYTCLPLKKLAVVHLVFYPVEMKMQTSMK